MCTGLQDLSLRAERSGIVGFVIVFGQGGLVGLAPESQTGHLHTLARHLARLASIEALVGTVSVEQAGKALSLPDDAEPIVVDLQGSCV